MLLLVVGGGCSTATEGDAGSPTAASTETGIERAEGTQVVSIDTTEAVDVESVAQDVQLITSRARGGPDETAFRLAGIGSDDSLLLVRGGNSLDDQGELAGQSEIYLQENDSQRKLLLSGDIERPRNTQITHAVGNDRWIVWQETSSTQIGAFPWKMYAFDREVGEAREVAAAPKAPEAVATAPGWLVGGVLDGGTLAWAQISANGQASEIDIVECRLKNCEPISILPNAARPAYVSNELHGFEIDPRARPVQPSGVIVSEDDSEKCRVPPGVKPTDLVGHGDVCAVFFTADGVPQVEVWEQSRVVARVTGTRDQKFYFPHVSECALVWAQGSSRQVGGYALRLDDNRIFSLGTESSLAPGPLGRTVVAWRSVGDSGSSVETRVGTLCDN